MATDMTVMHALQVGQGSLERGRITLSDRPDLVISNRPIMPMRACLDQQRGRSSREQRQHPAQLPGRTQEPQAFQPSCNTSHS